MIYSYDNQYDPPAPVIPITVNIPDDETKQMKTDALLDTGADITCLPCTIIFALGAEKASTCLVSGIEGDTDEYDTYFLEFEIVQSKKLVEVVAIGNIPILGRNIINEFKIELNGPTNKLEVFLNPENS